MSIIFGFSKLSKREKIDWLVNQYFKNNPEKTKQLLSNHWHQNTDLQELYDSFSENTISNFMLPLGVSPNFLIDGNILTVPMVTEESSVIAAASAAAKFWSERGGFKTTLNHTHKSGQVHFNYGGDTTKLQCYFDTIKPILMEDLKPLCKHMEGRGGGILSMKLIDKTEAITNYYQLDLKFDTVDAMGANFINSCLEQCATSFKREAEHKLEGSIEIIMSILSNYTPDCTVKVEASCPISKFNLSGKPEQDAERFVKAIDITQHCKYRATTHNKGIMNGIDAVAIATGNDFRAIEANVHAYACKDGIYKGLTQAKITGDQVHFWLEIPLAIGTVGGIVSSHPLVKVNLELLGNPNAKKLMQIMASAGLAQNFAALRSLVTTGIQKGHMKMHLSNILNDFNLTEEQKNKIKKAFKDEPVSYSGVRGYLRKEGLISE